MRLLKIIPIVLALSSCQAVKAWDDDEEAYEKEPSICVQNVFSGPTSVDFGYGFFKKLNHKYNQKHENTNNGQT